jgi:hypothetical protein
MRKRRERNDPSNLLTRYYFTTWNNVALNLSHNMVIFPFFKTTQKERLIEKGVYDSYSSIFKKDSIT